jgi:hypothetical protein
MKLNLEINVVAVAVLFTSLPFGSQAAELEPFDPSPCNHQGGLGVTCDVQAPNVLFSVEAFDALNNTRPPSSDEITAAKKIVAPSTGSPATKLEPFDASQCNEQDHLGVMCGQVPNKLFSFDSFNALKNARPASSDEINAVQKIITPSSK